MEQKIDNLIITDDPDRVDIDKVCLLLSNTYWAKTRPRNVIEKSIINSIPISIFDGESQVGFARVVTDYATFSWIADVIVGDKGSAKPS